MGKKSKSAEGAKKRSCKVSLGGNGGSLMGGALKIRTVIDGIGVDQNDLNKTFIQLTLEFLTKQKFEAYDSKGAVVAGDKNKEVLVRDIWVFEKSMFHPGSYWRLCGRVKF